MDEFTLTIDRAEWPHGIRCMDCREKLNDGDPYTERLSGMVQETPVTEVVCLACASGAS